MIKEIELASHIRLPNFPPSPIPLSLFILNMVLAFVSKNTPIFTMFSFIYGNLMMYRINSIEYYLRLVFILNAFPIWAVLYGVEMRALEGQVLFVCCLLLFGKVLGYAALGVGEALGFMKKVEFDDVYWVIQMASIFDFFYEFTGLRYLKYVPSVLRIVQNLRVNNLKATISASRYVLKIIRIQQPRFSLEGIALACIISIWEFSNNYYNHIQMPRVFKSGQGICIYPKIVIISGFVIICFCDWAWVWAGRYSSVFGVLSKIVWNYMRLESRIADLCRKYAVMEISELKHESDLHDIIY